MEWYEIIIGILIIPVGFYISSKVYKIRDSYRYNDSWKTTDKKRDFKY